MNGNTELLNFVYQNSEMGIETIEQLLRISGDDNFKKQLSSELDEYRMINEDAKKLLQKSGTEEKELGTAEKIRTYLMLNMQTMLDKSSSHIAEMMIIGSNMGVLQATKKLHQYNEAEKDIQELMRRLLRFEENNIQSLKEYL